MNLHSWLHRKGIARLINSGSNSVNDRGDAYVEARGPYLIAEALAVYALKHTPHLRFDWNSLLIDETEHSGTLGYGFHFTYRRLR